eukprot:4795783-Alexandrium_andersonii.AAC.1
MPASTAAGECTAAPAPDTQAAALATPQAQALPRGGGGSQPPQASRHAQRGGLSPRLPRARPALAPPFPPGQVGRHPARVEEEDVDLGCRSVGGEAPGPARDTL